MIEHEASPRRFLASNFDVDDALKDLQVKDDTSERQWGCVASHCSYSSTGTGLSSRLRSTLGEILEALGQAGDSSQQSQD